jgi:hypothetical protein
MVSGMLVLIRSKARRWVGVGSERVGTMGPVGAVLQVVAGEGGEVVEQGVEIV